MRIAVIPGSYNPPTLGHLDLIKRACGAFDKVYVAAMINENKITDFTIDESYEMLKMATADLENVQVEKYAGMLYQYVLDKGACAIVKGVRNEADLAYEKQMATFNKEHCGVDTFLLMADEKYKDLSSTKVRQMAQKGLDISGLVPADIIGLILKKYDK